MCGIAGIATVSPSEALRPAADLMASSMKHRGPDSQGVQEFETCLLVNARLSIIDLSDRGRMPMSSPDGQIWITYNGETYNAGELRNDLESRGHSFRTTTDTEVVAFVSIWNMANVSSKKLRGMFAFAIWDAGERKLVLGRDRLGIKPLYLHNSAGRLVFASELKTLLASGLVPRQLDPAGLRAFLQLGHIPPPWSAIRGVTPLAPGHIGIWKAGEWRMEPYWSLSPHSSRQPANDHLAADLSEVLLDAMRNHLVSDVPVLIFLSGGTDSACLGALARAAGAGNLSAMTVGFGETEFDESKLTTRTAEALGIPLEVVTLEARRVEADLDHAIWALDEPSVDGLNSYWISKLGAEAGFKVALSGQGGDELFGGYDSLAWFERFNAVARWARPLPAMPFGRMLDQNAFPFRWRKLSYLVGADDPFVAAQLAVKVLFLDRDVGELVSSSIPRNGHHAEAREHLTYWSKQVEERRFARAARVYGYSHSSGTALAARHGCHEHGAQYRRFARYFSIIAWCWNFLLPVPSEYSHAAEAAPPGRRETFLASCPSGGFGDPPETDLHISISALAIA